MNAVSNVSQVAEDLAGQWNESALQILRASGAQNISVAMELETWRIMAQILRHALRRKQASLENLKERALFQATLQARRKFDGQTDAAGWARRIGDWIRAHGSSFAEKELFWLAMQTEWPTRQTDYFPRLNRLANVG